MIAAAASQMDLTLNLVERKTGGLSAGGGISAQVTSPAAKTLLSQPLTNPSKNVLCLLKIRLLLLWTALHRLKWSHLPRPVLEGGACSGSKGGVPPGGAGPLGGRDAGHSGVVLL